MMQSSTDQRPTSVANSDRKQIVDGFIGNSAWADWDRNPLAGDASARRYERLKLGEQSVILMDDPTNPGQATDRFSRIARSLTEHGLCAPQILAHDPHNGLMIISDLGTMDFAQWLRQNPHDQSRLYHAAADVLMTIHRSSFDLGLEQLTPAVGGKMISLLHPYYTQNSIAELAGQLTLTLEEHAAVANTVALRDFHAENLIWRPDQTGHDRVGLLDFQDALYAPAGYDLASLLRDARRDIPTGLAENLISDYIENLRLGQDFRAQLAVLGVQRNLRILGIFGRLAAVDKKPRYLGLMPRVWAHIQQDLKHPALNRLGQCVNDILQPPEPVKPV